MHARLPSSSNGLDIAMDSCADDPSFDNPAWALLTKQHRLIDAQVDQLHRQRWRDVLIIVLGLLMLSGIGLFVWSASQADGVVVEPFSVPPDLAQQGLEGPVVATHLLDKLMIMQSQTISLRASSSYANNWDDDIQVEVPYAGVSLGELRRMLREWLGDQTKLSGEIVRLPDGRIALTSRVGSSPPTRVEGATAELDTLLQKAAEAIYSETQPYRYSVWLTRGGREEEATAVRLKLVSSDDENDQLWAYNGLGTNVGTYVDQKRYYEAALRIRRDFAPAIANLALTEFGFGHEEQTYRLSWELERHARAMRRELEPGRAEAQLAYAKAMRLALVGDYAGAAEVDRAALSYPTSPMNRLLAPLSLMMDLASAHQLKAIAKVRADEGLTTPRAMAERLVEAGSGANPAVSIARSLGDAGRERDLLVAELARASTEPLPQGMADPSNQLRAELAVAQARSGQVQQALATLEPTPMDCSSCTRARGVVLSYAGRHADADRMFALSIRQTPSLPLGHQAYSEALARRGEAERAITEARIAVQKGGCWAEAHATLADALMLGGSRHDALKSYAKAARIAPEWGALHIRWGDALWRTGERHEAQQMWVKASRLPLSSRDQARTKRRLGVAT